VDLQRSGDAGHDERWLQSLLHVHPELFPADHIEPGFGQLLSVCTELPVDLGAGRQGYIDNFFVTPEGRLVIVETKLWRNPGARREVVAQLMDYGAALFKLSYSELERQIEIARRAAGEADHPLAEIVRSGHPDGFDEPAFIDAVARNLRRGRAILAVVGDGIREDIQQISGLLQSHAGDRFIFALVELRVYSFPGSKAKLVVPSVLAETTLIERGVIRIENPLGQGVNVSVSAPRNLEPARSAARGSSLTEDEFFEALRENDANMAQSLKELLANLDEHGFYPDVQSTLNIKHPSVEGNALNLCSISKTGIIDTGPSTWWNRTEAGTVYGQTLAKFVGGFLREMRNGAEAGLRLANGRMPRLPDLLPDHADGWMEAMRAYVRMLSEVED
jgi:hypothetical protein